MGKPEETAQSLCKSKALLLALIVGLFVAVAAVLYLLHIHHKASSSSSATVQPIHYVFNLEVTSVQRLCQVQQVVTVNGMLPGPTLHLQDGQSVTVTVINNCPYNATIHWHGIRQVMSAWADGSEYITQCPIMPGGRYSYRFRVEEQEGTLWWHAHVSWLRATVHGAIVIQPKPHVFAPYSQPHGEAVLLLGEWWNANPMDVIAAALQSGGGPNISDALTINGQPGALYPCSAADTWELTVKAGERYLLRIINGAMNTPLFFKITDHDLQVVAVDASYVRPFTTDLLILAPGQTTDVIFLAAAAAATTTSTQFYMAAQAYASSSAVPFINTTATAVLRYNYTHHDDDDDDGGGGGGASVPLMPIMPPYNETPAVTAFAAALRGYHRVGQPWVNADSNMVVTVGLGLRPCSGPTPCSGPYGRRFIASMNNVSFVIPTTNSILQAAYQGSSGKVFTTDFPDTPVQKFDYTMANWSDDGSGKWNPESATKVRVLNFGEVVEVVIQGTSVVAAENHPMHLHGHDFYVVGQGFGNFDPAIHPLTTYNLLDPPRRNTVGVPVNGWVAIRFRATNPGAWFFHCHVDAHLLWGLAMVFVVPNGASPHLSLGSPPLDLPLC